MWAFSSRNSALLTEDPLFSSARGSHFHRVTEAPGPCGVTVQGTLASGLRWKRIGGFGRGMGPGSGTGLRSTIRREVAPQTFPAMQTSVTQPSKGPCRLEVAQTMHDGGRGWYCCIRRSHVNFVILLSLTDVSCFNIEMLPVFQLTLAKCSSVCSSSFPWSHCASTRSGWDRGSAHPTQIAAPYRQPLYPGS